MEDYPGNSRRIVPNEKPALPPAEDKRFDKVVTGAVIKRKKSLGRRVLDTLFSGDSSSVFGYLLKEVLVPALQATATDMVTQGIEKAVYGEVRSPYRGTQRGSSSVSRTHISYDRASSPGRPAHPAASLRRSAATQSSTDIGEVILDSKIDAQLVAEKMLEAIEDYGSVTVAQLNELLAQTSNITDYKWGWTDLTTLQIKRIREGWLLDLPDVEDLR